ncbi:DUF4145 domain-containing protein [Yersinia intermedia]|uniref:DUF4145 domain-containing protein n=1 Tax=Yersinia intermedia TaxID=631 RepID=UPI00065CF05E|nr:DUF4145 domain-containing protein [Yersinia intermedia]CRY84221.1 Uncharacterised protein [Yersinia intermedia]
MRGPRPDTAFSVADIPAWRCPACDSQTLMLVPESFVTMLTAFSRINRGEDWYEAEHEESVFSCLLKCSRADCQQPVAVSGEGQLEDEWDDRMQSRIGQSTYFRAKMFVPPLPVFNIPENCPYPIKMQLLRVAGLLAMSGEAAVNAMRSVLELLLDEMEVPLQLERENKSPRVLNLHNRIEEFPNIIGIHQAAFMALKWVGNSGSHSRRSIPEKDIDDAISVLDDLLTQLYGGVALKVTRLHEAHAPKKPS